MSCTSEALTIVDGNVEKVGQTTCVSIPSNVVSFSASSNSNTAWLFKETASSINKIDFSNAKNLEKIAAYTFYQCVNIKVFDLSACTSLNSVGIGAFQKCTGATSIIFPESPLDNLPGGCFSICESLESFIVPSNIIVINRDSPNNFGVFSGCKNLKNITFQENSKCQMILTKAFWNSGLETLTLPKSLEKIDGWSFRSVPSLKKILVEEGSKYFKSVDGVLYTTKNEVSYYPPKATQGTTAKMVEGTVGILDSAFNGIDSYTSIDIPSSVKYIMKDAFYSFVSLTSVTIPASVTSIGGNTFGSCSNLVSAVITNATENKILPPSMFNGCTSLKKFTVPSGFEIIDDSVFAGCTSLKEVVIPPTVKTFKNGVFRDCPSDLKLIFQEGSDMHYINGYIYNKEKTQLVFYIGTETTVTIISSVNTIVGGAFQGRNINKVIYENIANIQTIGTFVFEQCTKLKSVDIPNVDTIPGYAFSNSGLESVTIPSTVTTIDVKAFSGCNSLSTVVINSNLLTIKESAFNWCILLSSINVPNTVSTIEKNAFRGCKKLTTFVLPTALQTIGEEVFTDSGITSFTYDSNIVLTSITRFAFTKCHSFESFIIPNSVTKLEENSFSQCNGLKVITFGEGIAQIDNYAISHCPLLDTIKIGNNQNLREISSLAFYDCAVLDKIVLEGTNNFAFQDGMLFDKDKTSLMLFLKASNPKEIIIPATVNNIYMYAFSGCSSIENVTILGDVLNEIQMSAFENCTSLKYTTFPPSLVKIGTSAFLNCNLVSASIVNTKVKTLVSNVFANNKQLNLIVIPNTLTSCSENAFSNTGKNPIVFYYGTNIITNEVGLSKKAQVYCLNGYPGSIYLGLPVKTDYNYKCTLLCRRNNFVSYFTMLSFILIQSQ